MIPDLRLYLILDTAGCTRQAPAKVAMAAVAGGATLVQLRAKDLPTRDFIALAREVHRGLEGSGVPLLINDRVDVALAAKTEGVHLGQEDMAAQDARRLLGPDAMVGLTVRSQTEIEAAPLEVLDYLSIGGVFPTRSKNNTCTPAGLEGLQDMVARTAELSALPRCAIAGIDRDSCQAVIRTGVQGIAVISAICAAPDPCAAASELRRLVDAALAEKSASTSKEVP